MSTKANEHSSSAIWTGRPWITPDAAVRTLLIFIFVAIVVWLEAFVNAASAAVLGMSLWAFTILLFLVAWLVSLVPLLLLRASHRYTLRSDSVEVKTGLGNLNSFILAPSGFSDLEINQSIIGRIVGYGDITIHTQSDRMATMQKVKNPVNVANLIREIMGKPIVRIEGLPPQQPQSQEKK
jgi:membrane protein YdbS with pleckstrin-like domain